MALIEMVVFFWFLYKVGNAIAGSQTQSFEKSEDNFWEMDDLEDRFEDTYVGLNLVSADDMELLSDAGYDPIDVEFMEPGELKDAMEDAGVDTFLYDFDE